MEINLSDFHFLRPLWLLLLPFLSTPTGKASLPTMPPISTWHLSLIHI